MSDCFGESAREVLSGREELPEERGENEAKAPMDASPPIVVKKPVVEKTGLTGRARTEISKRPETLPPPQLGLVELASKVVARNFIPGNCPLRPFVKIIQDVWTRTSALDLKMRLGDVRG